MLKLKFTAFKPVDDLELSERYLKGHTKVLEDYGITNITSNNRVWLEMPCIYGVVAQNEEGELVGGIRVQMADGIHPLPVEKAVGHMDGRIYDVVKQYYDNGVGELSALWNAKSVAGYGISVLLTRAGISMTNQMGCNTLVGICGDYTLDMFKNVGFVVDNTLGSNGEFFYPKEDFIARVLGILNSKNLETAEKVNRERMLDLRNNPVQKYMETGPKGLVEIDYNLVIPTKAQ
ncbi:hypothetical protein GCM10023093_24620 [Nemorincola caseinilytica]|uniref:N-acetyltransferase domain-containing protein n=1 Tax=Nemorincola caseinilytica TaxID=2054315 RepID=A0ABP8NIL8_9BACT